MLIVVCNQRGLDEIAVARSWTFRRLLYTYIVLMKDRAWFMPIVNSVLGGITGSKLSEAPSRSVKPENPERRIPSWFRPKKSGSRITWAHVEDDLSYISNVVPLGIGKAGGKRAMGKFYQARPA